MLYNQRVFAWLNQWGITILKYLGFGGFVALLFWIKNLTRSQKIFSFAWRRINLIYLSNGGMRSLQQNIQLLLESDEDFQFVKAFIDPQHIPCETNKVIRSGEGLALEFNSGSLPLKDGEKLSLKIIVQDQDGDYYKFVLPMVIRSFGTRYELHDDGTGQRRRVVLLQRWLNWY